jgi:thiol-disulfide isomerase/thioredoxin
MNQLKKMRLAALLSLTLGGLSAAIAQEPGPSTAPTLSPGDRAPALKLGQWVQGQKIEKFEPGKVYVVEFWATWCGPCRDTIPHLNRMAAEFGEEATFLGVSVWENDPEVKDTAYYDKVQSFVKDMQSDMSYAVAVDTPDQAMARTWLEAAKEDGIPVAFVVDQESRVVWIGHPMDNLETVVRKVIDKEFDWQAEAKARQERREQEERLDRLMEPFMKALESGEYRTALAELDKVIQSDPIFEDQLGITKFTLLLTVDEAEAYKYAEALSKSVYRTKPMELNAIAWTILDENSGAKKPDVGLALRIAQQAVDSFTTEEPQLAFVLDTLGLAHFRNNDLDKAIATQERAIAILDKHKDKVPAHMDKEIRERLAEYKKKRG